MSGLAYALGTTLGAMYFILVGAVAVAVMLGIGWLINAWFFRWRR